MSMGWLKHYMPRSLYGRATLILLLPVVFVQLVVTVIFTQRHFEDVTHQMTDAALREVRLALRVIEEGGTLEAALPELAMTYRTIPDEALELPDFHTWDDISGRIIIKRIKMLLPQLRRVMLTDEKEVFLSLTSAVGPVEIGFDRRRVSAANPHQLLVYMVFFSILITLIALIYLRNQLRPIKRLARAAEAFGRGRVEAFAPAGAIEVRAAGAAFIDMRNRLERQIETRTLMLSGVSHDLRTPLTRMRLALALLDDEDRAPLEADVEEMQEMIDAFLDFAKAEQEDTAPEKVDPIALAGSVVEDAQRAGLDVSLVSAEGEGMVALRSSAMRRALMNLIVNAARYAGRAEVSAMLTDKSLRLRVEDDGPGIAESDRERAVRPFLRLDAARNQDKGGGTGLGLAIATDIARGHGGVLRLGESERLGGLQADIVIAR